MGADIYSFAIMLWELVTLERPHKDIHHDVAGLTKLVVHQQGRLSLERIPIRPLRELLDVCWQPETSERPTSEKLVKDMMEDLPDAKQQQGQEETSQTMEDVGRPCHPDCRTVF
jgi:hypothetical protein